MGKSVFNNQKNIGGHLNVACLSTGRPSGVIGEWTISCNANATFDATGVNSPTLLLPTSLIAVLFDMLPIVPSSFAASSGTAPAANQWLQPHKMYIRSAKVKTSWQNVNNYGLTLEAYYCKPRQDLGTVNNTIDQIYAAGWNQESDPTGGSADWAAPSLASTPFDNHLFCKKFKIYKVKKRFVPAGEGCSFTLTRKKPFIIDINRFAYASNTISTATYIVTQDMLKGISKFILYRFKGIVGNAATTPGQTNVTVGIGTMDYVTEHRYQIQSLVQPMPINTIMASSSNNGVLTLPATPAGGFSFVNDAEDTSATATQS